MHPANVKQPFPRGRRRKALVFPVLLPLLVACSLLQSIAPEPTPTATEPPPSATPTITTLSFTQLGSRDNPLVLALPAGSTASSEVISAGKTLVGLLEQSTGYTFVTVVPPTEADLVAGFGNGNAHIGVLSPFAYLLVSQEGTADATFARQQGDQIFYGAQFIARQGTGFTSYFDELKGGNTADADTALSQFQDRKPCWSDARSPSGYVVPLGYLRQSNVRTLPPAFLAGHIAVVRSVDVGGICDFGATYVDARAYPGLQDQYPNLMRDVNVIWRIPPIIPYETLVFVHGMDEGMHRVLTRAFVDAMTTSDGQSAMQILYGFQAMQVVQDSQYDPFRKIVNASGLDLNDLIK